MKQGWTWLARLAGCALSLIWLWWLVPSELFDAWLFAPGPSAVAPFHAGRFEDGPAVGSPAARAAVPAAGDATTGEPVGNPLPSASEVLRRLQQAVAALRDARARVEAEVVEADGRRVRSVVDAWVLRQPAVVRLQVVEPATLADQVYVIDFERRSVSVYLPVTRQVVVQALDERLPAVTGLGQFGPALWLQPVPSEFEQSARLVGTDGQGSRLRYVLEGSIGTRGGNPATQPSSRGAPSSRGNEAQTGANSAQMGSHAQPAGPAQPGGPTPARPIVPGSEAAWWASGRASTVQVWVNGSTWLAERLVAYDTAGREVASVVLRDLRVNAGLKPQDLRRLPEGAEVVQG